MTESQPAAAERLLAIVTNLINLFSVDESMFPATEGRERYNPIDFQTLKFVETHANARATDIGDALRVAPTTLQSVLDRLLEKGLLERDVHPDDGRARIYRLSAIGAAMRAAIQQQDLDNMGALLAGMDANKREIVLEQMEKTMEALKG